MNEFGITKEGFKLKSREDILLDMEIMARNLFGDQVNLGDSSPLGLFIKLNAHEMSRVWQMAEGIYNATFLNTATGQSLDNIANYLGIKRKAPLPAKGKVLFSGKVGAVVEAGTLVESNQEEPIQFKTTNQRPVSLAKVELRKDDGSIEVVGQSELEIIALESGEKTNLPAELITKITKPVSGIASVTNLNPTQGGQDLERDFELRERYKKSVSAVGGSTLAAIKSEVLQVPDVRACSITENDSFEFDSKNRPPKSFEVVVLGGRNQDIGEAIFAKKAAGIHPYGKVTVIVVDDSGQEHSVSFSRAEESNIYLDISIKIDSAVYPENGEIKIKDALLAYIGGDNSKGEKALGLSLGENVIYTKLYDVIYSVAGVKDVNVKLGLDRQLLQERNVEISSNQVAITSLDKIKINYSAS